MLEPVVLDAAEVPEHPRHGPAGRHDRRLPENPLDVTDWEAPDAAVAEVSPRVVASPAIIRARQCWFLLVITGRPDSLKLTQARDSWVS
jgi:hypothetical protein